MAWEIQKPGIVNRAETLEREVSYYAVCSTAAGTAAKTISVDPFFRLETGAKVCVRFSNTNTASTPTLNVNGTGAKQIRYRNASGTSGYLSEYVAANRTYDLVYDGSYWQIVGDVDTILDISDSTSSSSSTTAASSAAVKNLADLISALTTRVASLESQLADGTWPLMPSADTVQELVFSTGSWYTDGQWSTPSGGTWFWVAVHHTTTRTAGGGDGDGSTGGSETSTHSTMSWGIDKGGTIVLTGSVMGNNDTSGTQTSMQSWAWRISNS